jgi:dTDP-4-amino-4,6-dideoxygalactose transaminase
MTQRQVPAARIVFSEADRQTVLAMIDQSLQSGSLTLGPHTAAFEETFRQRHGAPFAIAVSSGTAALEIIFRAIEVTGADVIVPANTFFATAAAVVHAGGRMRLADVAADTMALSVETIEAALTPQTKAVVLVHIGGLISPQTPAIRQLCDQRGIVLIEDAAHAHGSSLNGTPAGQFSEAAAFSFYPTKVITTGEGGMIVTADSHLHDEAIIYRDQGKAGFLGGDHVRMGYAWRLSELHAAVGAVHLSRLDEYMAVRRAAAKLYDGALEDIDGVDALPVPDRCVSNYYKYVALLEPGLSRSEVKQELKANYGVSLTGEVYALPLHRQPVFEREAAGQAFPVADDVCARHICLPVHSDMSLEEAAYVADSLRSAIKAVRDASAGKAGSTR